MRFAVLTFAFAVVVASPACICTGPVAVQDPFEKPASRDVDSLHTYASHARVPLTVLCDGVDVDQIRPFVSDGTGFGRPGTARATIEDLETDDDDQLKFTVVTDDPGTVTIEADLSGDQALFVRTLTVVDVDDIALAVTAPLRDDLELPDVDPAGVRIWAGGQAAFRTTLTADGAEVFGLSAVTATPADDTFTTRAGVGCSSTTCDAVRNAVEVHVPAAAVDPVEVGLTAGDAALTLTVIPTPASDVTDAVLVESAGGDDRDPAAVVEVLAGDERVLGAPVGWSVDGAAIENDQGAPVLGDALTFKAGGDAHDVVASLGDRALTASLSGSDFSVTSITAACGAAGSAPLAGALALLGIAAFRRRRGR